MPSITEIEFDVDFDTLNFVYGLPDKLSDMSVFVDDWQNVIDNDMKPTDYLLLYESDKHFANSLLRLLSKREREILKLHLGFDCQLGENFNTIGGYYNISRERARQIFGTAIKKLQEILGVYSNDEE